MMKHQPKPCLTEIEDEDEDFLSQVAAVEADALSNKRRKTTPASGGAFTAPKEECDGLYTAALKGNNSLSFVPKSAAQGRNNLVTVAGAHAVSSGGCFKCGNFGHWARDCVEAGSGSAGGGRAGGYIGNFGNDETAPEKPCPCGLGACLILTANTEKNRGRKFYRCPLRQENGGCNFFEWCDSTAGTTITGGSHTVESYSRYPDIQCPCGAPGHCQILTARTGKNAGQPFYRCPYMGSSCGFFKWCNEVAAGVVESAGPYKSSYNIGDKNKPISDVKSGSACFKCGKEGHWAKDCSITSASYSAAEGKRSASSGNCYKCNNPGHWARDCPLS